MYGEKHDLHHEFPEYEKEIRHLKMHNMVLICLQEKRKDISTLELVTQP